MRIFLLAAILVISALSKRSAAVAATSRVGHGDGYFRSVPWGIVPNGGDSLPGPRDSINGESADKIGATNYEIDNQLNQSRTDLIRKVSGGGALQENAAFVSSSNASQKQSHHHLKTTQRKSPPFGTGESEAQNEISPAASVSSLPATTNRSDDSTTVVEEPINSEKEAPIHGRKDGPLKILFLSSDTGGGHRASAEALADQFRRLYPGTTYDLFDIWTDVETSWPYYTIKDCYKSFSATPWKWRALYHVSNNVIYAKAADLHSYYMNEDNIREKMETYDPDVVISVHPTMNYVPLFSTRKISNKLGKDIPFFTVVTDFGSGHSTWFNKDVDKMYLASEPIKRIAQVRGGVPDEKIIMSGLPIRYDFAAQADAMGDRTTAEGKSHQATIREKLHIDTDKRMVLVMGGGEGVGSLSDIVNELYVKLRTQGVNATICVVCGRNEKLKSDLETRCWDAVVSQSADSYESLKSRFFSKLLKHASRSRRIQMALDRAAAKHERGSDVADVPGNVDVVPFGFVQNMAELMVCADVLVSKAGPGTIAEAASVGLPVMVTSHLPGQEAGNVDIGKCPFSTIAHSGFPAQMIFHVLGSNFLVFDCVALGEVLNGGFGDFCEDPESIALEVACWLQDSQLLDVMSKNAMKVGHPHAAEEIALDIGETTHEWLERNRMKCQGS